MKSCNNLENKTPSDTYWRVQLVCKKVQAHTNVKQVNCPNYFYCLNSDVVSVLDPWICQSVCLQSKGCLAVKTVKASIKVSDVP